MKFLVLLCAVATVARGAHVVAPVGVVSQYHAQDELGQYSYGYSGGPSAKYETRTADGVTRGGYSYVDAHGLVQIANYVSDAHNGFRVAATDIPVGPAAPATVPDAIPAVHAAVVPAAVPVVVPAVSTYHAIAPTGHLLGRKRRALYPAYYTPRGFSYATISTHAAHPYVAAYPYYSAVSPLAVHDTPAVAAAKAAHFTAVHQATLRNALHGRKRRHVAVIASAPVAYSALSPVAAYSTAVPLAHAAAIPLAHAAVLPVVRTAVAPVAVASPVVPAVAATSQYHAQDELGQYSYGYSGGPSAKHETKTADGVTQGGYSYVDAHGLVQTVAYTADAHNGFRVAATNLPVH